MVYIATAPSDLHRQRALGLVFQQRQREKVSLVEQLQREFFAQRAARMAQASVVTQ